MKLKQIISKTKHYFLGYRFPDENRTKLFWLIHLRWLAIISLLSILYFVYELEWIQSPFTFLYILTIINLIFLNIASSIIAKRLKEISLNFVFFQLLSDLSAITFLLTITGGIWNPLIQVIYMNVILGAILLRKVQAFIFFICTILSILILHYPNFTSPAFSIYPNKNPILLSGQLVLCCLIFILTHWISCSLSKQKKYSEMLLNENSRLDKLRALGALSAGFSHEFATPLNTIKLRVERIERKYLSEENLDIVAIKKAIFQCESAIKQMHNKSLSDEKTLFETKNIYALVNKILASWRCEEIIVKFSCETNFTDLNCKIPVLAFTKAFIDILDNAKQANQNQANANEINVSLQRSKNFIELSVNDQGPGWPLVIKKYAGKPFLTTKDQGVGLGLYNAFSFASAVNGKFKLLDNEFGGACAQFLIPIYDERSTIYEEKKYLNS